jgi:putative Mg2+ transporter-C (MgtC) family protein
MLQVEVDNNSLTPELLRTTLSLRIGQVKRFLLESRGPDGIDQLSILLTKASAQDMASFPDLLREMDGVREVTIAKRSNAKSANSRD